MRARFKSSPYFYIGENMIILNIVCFISLIISIFLFYITNKIKIHKDI